MICTRLDAPIVLAHGMFGFTRIGWGPLTLAEYFKDIPGALRAFGNRVLVTRVHPTAGVVWRARRLAHRIETALPEGPFHIIGHSMGGLDSRELLTDPAWRRRILSLTTIGTPHIGTPLAFAARKQVGWVYQTVHRLGWDCGGIDDISPTLGHRFHRLHPVPADLPCFSMAGDPGPGRVCPPLRRFYDWLSDRAGPNDGLVPRDSALAFGTPLPDWRLDHLQQMNWFRPEWHGLPPALGLYEAALANLAQLGFGETFAAEIPAESWAGAAPAPIGLTIGTAG